MKISLFNWYALQQCIDAVPQKEWPATADVRKATAVVDQISKNLKGTEIEDHLELEKTVQDILRPFNEKLLQLDKKDVDYKAKTDELLKESNSASRDLRMELVESGKKIKEIQLEIEIDPNYKAFVKANWEKKIRPVLNFKESVIEISDAFNIE